MQRIANVGYLIATLANSCRAVFDEIEAIFTHREVRGSEISVGRESVGQTKTRLAEALAKLN